MSDFNSLSTTGKVAFAFDCISMVIAVLGTIGNLLTFVVFSRKRFKNYSFSLYLRIMVISDTIVLLHSVRIFCTTVLNMDISLVSDLICKLSDYSNYVAAALSVWLLALVSFDRLISIVFPFRFLIFKKRHFQLIVVSVLIAYSLFLYLPMPIYTDIINEFRNKTNETNTSRLIKSCVLQESKTSLVYLTDLVNLTFVTFLVNNVLAFAIISFIFNSRKKSIPNDSKRKSALRDRKFAINSIVLNLICFVCKTPTIVILVCSTYLRIEEQKAVMMFSISVSIFIIDNSSAFFVNFYLNSIFHDEFLAIINLKSRRSVRPVFNATFSLKSS